MCGFMRVLLIIALCPVLVRMISRRKLPSLSFDCTYTVIGVLREQWIPGGQCCVAGVVGIRCRGVYQPGGVIDGGRRRAGH